MFLQRIFQRGFSKLTHVNEKGSATMVDISHKMMNKRTACASASVIVGRDIYKAIQQNELAKGDVLGVAKLAGIMGSKKTHELIPLCHPINLNFVDVKCELQEPDRVKITSIASVCDATGVEMEALTGASIAALTVYDMCKAMSKSIVITDIQLESKTGGKSGVYQR